jgi:Fe-S-cluster containining protein
MLPRVENANARENAKKILRQKRRGKWYEAGLRFKCLAPDCVDCCSGKRGPGYVWLNFNEMHAIAEFLGKPFEMFTRNYVRQVGNKYSLIEKPNDDCVFLKDGGCGIYPVRPTQCRTYPFWHEVMAGENNWQKESTECPGIGGEAPLVPGYEVTRQLNEDRAARGIATETV